MPITQIVGGADAAPPAPSASASRAAEEAAASAAAAAAAERAAREAAEREAEEERRAALERERADKERKKQEAAQRAKAAAAAAEADRKRREREREKQKEKERAAAIETDEEEALRTSQKARELDEKLVRELDKPLEPETEPERPAIAGRPQSSLRVGRLKSSRNHIDRPKAKGRGGGRFSALYEEDEEDAMDDGSKQESPKKLPAWAPPPGFSFAKDVRAFALSVDNRC